MGPSLLLRCSWPGTVMYWCVLWCPGILCRLLGLPLGDENVVQWFLPSSLSVILIWRWTVSDAVYLLSCVMGM